MEGVVTEKENGYLIEQKSCKLLVGFDRVMMWEKRLLPVEEYPQRAKEAPEDDVEANYILALWCKEHGLGEKAELHFNRVFKYDPDHKEARLAAGFVRYEKKWILRDEYLRLKGYRFVGGRWLSEEKAGKTIDRIQKRAKYKKEKAKAISLILKVIKNKNIDESLLVKELCATYPYSYEILRSYSSHYKDSVRRLVVQVLALQNDEKSAGLLCRRAYAEKHPRIQRDIAEALSFHPASGYIAEEFISHLLDTESRYVILRVAYVFQIMENKNVIPVLIEKSDYSPTKPVGSSEGSSETAQAKDEAALPEDKESSDNILTKIKEQQANPQYVTKTGTSIVEGHYSIYPAAECLKILTGQDFGTSKESWKGWWEENRDIFVFTEAKIPALSKRSESRSRRPRDPYADAMQAYTLGRD